jgi:tryptophan halogenase
MSNTVTKEDLISIRTGNSGEKPNSIGIVGSGTAGLIAALLLRRAFPYSDITIISSSKVGIIGVGEGSTEHWRQFMEICEIPLEEMLIATSATHKYGIRYENWCNKNPDYFHSVGHIDDIFAFGLYGVYMGLLEQDRLFTPNTSSVGLVKDKISRNGLHKSTNQFHFDTFKLNEYFTSLAFQRSIKFVDGEVGNVLLNAENGNIETVKTVQGDEVSASFWFDASGFSRVLMKKLDNSDWVSFSKYLLSNTAIPFPTESDPNGRIRAYTRARAASSGWMWEIPTQERRGNGYVFCSEFLSTDEAVAEAEKMSGYKIENPRVISFEAGYLRNAWVKNCIAVGLASSFVEPLEATSIGSTIQQVRQSIPYIAAYAPGNFASQKHFNKAFDKMMRNILTMIRLHYHTDRKDTPFWMAMSNMPINEELQEILELWAERPPSRYDFDSNSGEMFQTPHIAHVAQGQGVISKEACTRAMNMMSLREQIFYEIDTMRQSRHNHELVDHATALRELTSTDEAWLYK